MSRFLASSRGPPGEATEGGGLTALELALCDLKCVWISHMCQSQQKSVDRHSQKSVDRHSQKSVDSDFT
jgi:hypothetical protein